MTSPTTSLNYQQKNLTYIHIHIYVYQHSREGVGKRTSISQLQLSVFTHESLLKWTQTLKKKSTGFRYWLFYNIGYLRTPSPYKLTFFILLEHKLYIIHWDVLCLKQVSKNLSKYHET